MFLVDYLVHIFQALGKPSLWYPGFMIIITFAFPVNLHKTERLEEILILQPILRSTRTGTDTGTRARTHECWSQRTLASFASTLKIVYHVSMVAKVICTMLLYLQEGDIGSPVPSISRY